MTLRESDGRIVPLKSGIQSDGMKPSNIGAGKAAGPIRDPDRASTVLRDGPSVITRLDHIHQRAETQPNAVFNNLFSLLNEELLWHAFRRLKRGKSPGRHSAVCQELPLRGMFRAAARTTRRTPPGCRQCHACRLRSEPAGQPAESSSASSSRQLSTSTQSA